MELIVITPPDYFEGEADLINQFFATGLRLLHIRKPVDDVLKFRELMKEIDQEYYPLISIHQHHELAEEFALRRLHFKEAERSQLSVAHLKSLRSDGFHLSSSVHDLEELAQLQEFDYVFFGPVFDSISKAGYKGVLADDIVLPSFSTKVFAIGGVQANRLQQLKNMNFNGAAVLGTLWHQKVSPLAALKKLLIASHEPGS